MYGEPRELSVEYARVDDDYTLKISGVSECLFDGFMDKGEYYSEFSETVSA